MKRLALLALSASLSVSVLASCKDDAGGDGESGADESSTGPDPTTASETMSTTMPATTDPTTPGCIEGSENCACLDGECVGELSCIDEVCKPGPSFDPDDDDRTVLGGLVVPVVVDIIADESSWSQADGPTVEWTGEGTAIQVAVPADATPGDVITMRITAVRNTVEATFDYHITVLEPVFEDLLVAITDPEELGTSVGLDFDDNGNMWVSSSEGFLSRFSTDGAFFSRYDLADVGGIRWGRLYFPEIDDDVDVLYAAQSSGSISAYNPNNDMFQVITDQLEDATPLGTIDVVLPDGGNLFMVDSAGGRILRYTEEDALTRVLTTSVVAPSVLAFGPDANVLYVGAPGQVFRVGLLQDGAVAEPEVYLDFGDPADPLEAVGGLSFDEGGNLWVGVPGTNSAHIAHYVASGASSVARSFTDVGAGLSSFASVRHGNGENGNSAVYWANGSDRTVARVETGLQGM